MAQNPPVAARGRAADAPRPPRPVAERVVGGRGYAASNVARPSHVVHRPVPEGAQAWRQYTAGQRASFRRNAGGVR